MKTVLNLQFMFEEQITISKKSTPGLAFDGGHKILGNSFVLIYLKDKYDLTKYIRGNTPTNKFSKSSSAV
jgi:hypothetical protein